MELIYIGDKFYNESSSVMSCLYTTDGARSDWCFVNVALRNGENVRIRQATTRELKKYQRKLDMLISESA